MLVTARLFCITASRDSYVFSRDFVPGKKLGILELKVGFEEWVCSPMRMQFRYSSFSASYISRSAGPNNPLVSRVVKRRRSTVKTQKIILWPTFFAAHLPSIRFDFGLDNKHHIQGKMEEE